MEPSATLMRRFCRRTGIRADAAWFTGVTDVMIQKERDEILRSYPGGYPGAGADYQGSAQ
ncbi:MAG: hypothetical protein ACLR8P_11910 [Clostridium fessum]